MKQGIYNNIPNDKYHSPDGFMSSSQLKLLLKDPIAYHKKYILGDFKQEHKDYFDVGTAWHVKILEPHLFDKEITFYSGHRGGAKWKEFKAKNKDRVILGNKSKMEFDILCKGIDDSKIVKPYLEGKNEVSVYVMLDGYPIKVRFDVLNQEKHFAADPKSTQGDLTGNAGMYACRKKIADMGYDLSAALYMDAYNLLIEKLNKKAGKELYKPLTEWYWIFGSKDSPQCRIFRATAAMLQNGRKKYKLAIELLKKYEASDWKIELFDERVEDIDPLPHDIVGSNTEVAEW